ncbi:hypothetical protein [Calothrix sp. NIES-2100]
MSIAMFEESDRCWVPSPGVINNTELGVRTLLCHPAALSSAK